MVEQVKDMTKGPSGRLIIGLALPLMLGNVCQQLYTILLLYTHRSPVKKCDTYGIFVLFADYKFIIST